MNLWLPSTKLKFKWHESYELNVTNRDNHAMKSLPLQPFSCKLFFPLLPGRDKEVYSTSFSNPSQLNTKLFVECWPGNVNILEKTLQQTFPHSTDNSIGKIVETLLRNIYLCIPRNDGHIDRCTTAQANEFTHSFFLLSLQHRNHVVCQPHTTLAAFESSNLFRRKRA